MAPKRLYLEKRPTSVTTIGWASIIFGTLMILWVGLSASMFAAMSMTIPPLFAVLVAGQLAVGLLALVAGISFLGMKAWARSVLELLSWIELALIVATTVRTAYSRWTVAVGTAPALIGLATTLIYVIPLAVIIAHLRGRRVRDAMAGITDIDAEG